MEPVEIKILLLRAGITQTSIAQKLDVTLGFVNQIISGYRPTRRVREAIAEAVGKPVEKLWPRTTPCTSTVQGTSGARFRPENNQKKAMNHIGTALDHALNHHGTGHIGSRVKKAA